MSELSIIAIPLAIAAVVLFVGFVGCHSLFGLDPIAPPGLDVTTLPATDISSHGATLNGTVNPGGQATYQFEYGTTPAYGMTTAPMTAPVTLATPTPVSDLTPGTVYYFALTAADAGTADRGDQLMFATLPPLGFWPLDEDAGPTAVDRSPNQLNGTYSASGVVYGVPDLQAAGGGTGPMKAARFDGTGDMRVDFDPRLNQPSFRVDVLAMASAAPFVGTYGPLMSTISNGLAGYAIRAGSGGYWELFLGDGSTSSLQSAFLTSTAAVVPDQIVAISASYDANTLAATLTVTPDALIASAGSGQSVTRTASTPYVPADAARLRVAGDSTAQNFFRGVVANVYVSAL